QALTGLAKARFLRKGNGTATMANPNCQCQLFAWGPADIKYESHIEPSLPQDQVPSVYREIDIPEGSREAYNGRMMLMPAGQALSTPAQPAIWKIEALDSRGVVVPRAFEFRLVDTMELIGHSTAKPN